MCATFLRPATWPWRSAGPTPQSSPKLKPGFIGVFRTLGRGFHGFASIPDDCPPRPIRPPSSGHHAGAGSLYRHPSSSAAARGLCATRCALRRKLEDDLLMMFWLWWLVVGVVTGYLASRRPALSLVKCVSIGMVLGPLAMAMFFLPTGFSEPPQVSCPYCSHKLAAGTRLCQHCGAILVGSS